MSAISKKIISILLAIVMSIGVFSISAFAKDDSSAEKTETTITAAAPSEVTESIVKSKAPSLRGSGIAATIIVPGISQSTSTYCDKNGNPIKDSNGNELSGGLLIIDSSNIAWTLIKKLALPVIFSLLSQSVSMDLGDKIYEVVSGLFSIQASDKNGDAVNNLVVDKFDYPLSQYNEDDKSWFYNRLPMEPVIEEINETYGVNGEDYTYLYTFPLIGDPMTSGEGLFDFISMVKEQTGCSKVNLVGISLGGTIITAYCDLVMEKGGDFSDINKIIGVVACFNGTDLFADFYARNWNLSDEFLYGDYITAIMEESGSDEYVGHLINIALRILPKKVLYAILSSAMDGILDTLLVNCPQFWSMVPSDRYEELANKYFADSEYATLKARTDRFQEARLDLQSNLETAKDNYGVGVYTVSGYGRQYDTGDYNFLGIAASSVISNSDSIIDIDSTSLGATYAPAGEQLTASGAYASPEKEIDASTCAFTSTAWFFYGQHHEVGRDDVVIKLLANIITDNVSDITSSASFPQYNFNRNTRSLTRENGLIEKAESVIANTEGKYTAEEIAAVQQAYDKATAMLANTVMTADSADEAVTVTQELNDALAPTGLTSKSSTTSFFVKLLNKITGAIDSLVMKKVGGKGFSDVKK